MENEEIISAQPQAENFTVRFNHQDMILSPEEAVEYAQKGLKLESLKPMIDELNYLAYLRGKSPDDTIREFIDLENKIKEAELKEQFKDDENAFTSALRQYKDANELKRKELFCGGSKIKELNEKSLCDGFFKLKEKCPEIDSFDKIPTDVLKNAGKEDLLLSYLQFFHDEQMKIQKNENLKNENLLAASGELRSGSDIENSLLAQFIKGINK